MSTDIQNLKEAIIGESNAKRKYELYAEKAREENLLEVAHLFKAIAVAEAIHIKNHIK
ncbi:MAG: ferritin family protein [Candidatus Hermodarchaeota archaeon]